MAIVQSGLVAHWDASNPASYSGSGSTWHSLAGSTRDITTHGVWTYNAGGWFDLGGLNTGTYGDFDASNLPYGSSAFSLGAWINPNAAGSDHRIFGYGSDSLNDHHGVWFNGSWKYANGGGYSDSGFSTSNIPYQLGGWYYVVAAIQNGTSFIYINGLPFASATVGLSSSATSAGMVGHPSSSYYDFWAGSISELQVYSKQLSEAEVNQNFSASKSRFASAGLGGPYPIVTGGSTTPAVPNHPSLPSVL